VYNRNGLRSGNSLQTRRFVLGRSIFIQLCVLLCLAACSALQVYPSVSLPARVPDSPALATGAARTPSLAGTLWPLLSTATPETYTAAVQTAPQKLQVSPILPSQGEASIELPDFICSPLGSHTLTELPQIVSAPYAPPPPGREERHQGIDFSYYSRDGRPSIQGETVRSVLTGYVAAVVDNRFPYGNMVIVETPREFLPVGLIESLKILTGESLYSLYAHLENPPQVNLSELVAACQPVGEVGQTGNAGVPHLHLEMRLGPAGKSFSSLAYYDLHATQEEKENYLSWRISGVFRHFDPMLVLTFP
jgi:murein DD-endopeptidase MepM/ murein hydrolase activator NlpD